MNDRNGSQLTPDASYPRATATRDVVILDDCDGRILHILRHAGRISNAELARRIGLSPSACLSRVRSLEARRVITGYTTEIDYRKLGLGLEALISVRIRAGARHLMSALSNEWRGFPEVSQLFFLGGSDDFLLHVRVRDSDHLREFVLRALSNNQAIAGTQTQMIFEHVTPPGA